MASSTKSNPMPAELLAQFAELLRKKQPDPTNTTSINIKLKDNSYLYAIRSRTVQLVLLGRGRTGYITGKTVSLDPDDPGYRSLGTDGQSCSEPYPQLDSMEPDIAAQFILCPNTKELWEEIEATYHDGGDKLKLYELKQRAYQTNQADMSVNQYYRTVQGIWREIDYIQPQTMKCTEDRKTYDLGKQEDRVFAFLWGLEGSSNPKTGFLGLLAPLKYWSSNGNLCYTYLISSI